jgi:uncharacterized protein with PQ loop repeat
LLNKVEEEIVAKFEHREIMSNSSDLDNAFAWIGGLLLALCLVPEIVIMIRNKSARDVSFAWTILHISGDILTFVYLVRVKAVAGYMSLIPEMALVLMVVATKIFLDMRYANNDTPAGEVTENGNVYHLREDDIESQRAKIHPVSSGSIRGMALFGRSAKYLFSAKPGNGNNNGSSSKTASLIINEGGGSDPSNNL